MLAGSNLDANLDDYKWQIIRNNTLTDISDTNYDVSVIDELNELKWVCCDEFTATTTDHV